MSPKPGLILDDSRKLRRTREGRDRIEGEAVRTRSRAPSMSWKLPLEGFDSFAAHFFQLRSRGAPLVSPRSLRARGRLSVTALRRGLAAAGASRPIHTQSDSRSRPTAVAQGLRPVPYGQVTWIMRERDRPLLQGPFMPGVVTSSRAACREDADLPARGQDESLHCPRHEYGSRIRDHPESPGRGASSPLQAPLELRSSTKPDAES
jgi:hypothetical protein